MGVWCHALNCDIELPHSHDPKEALSAKRRDRIEAMVKIILTNREGLLTADECVMLAANLIDAIDKKAE